MGDVEQVEVERVSRARIPQLEAELAALRVQLEGSHRVQAQLRAELALTQRVVRSVLAGLAGPEQP